MTKDRYNRLIYALHNRQPDIGIILENVSDPHNIAAVMRTCDAVGVQEIFVLNDEAPRKRNWGFKCSGGSEKWVTVQHYDNKLLCLQAVRKNFQCILTTHLSSDAISLFDIDFARQSIALVFGNELKGVSNELQQLCDGNFAVPMKGVTKSLNISVACAVSLYEALRQKTLAGHYDQQRISNTCFTSLQKQWNFSEINE